MMDPEDFFSFFQISAYFSLGLCTGMTAGVCISDATTSANPPGHFQALSAVWNLQGPGREIFILYLAGC